MAHCSVCGEHDGLSNTCNFCGQKHCKAHILPENHDCPGLASNKCDEFGTDGRHTIASPATNPTPPDQDRSESTPSSGTIRPDRNQRKTNNSTGTASADLEQDDANPSIDTSPLGLPSSVHRVGQLTIGLGILLLGGAVAVLSFSLSFLLSKRGLSLVFVLAITLGGFSAIEGTGIEVVDGSVDSMLETASPILAAITDSMPSQTAGGDAADDGSTGTGPDAGPTVTQSTDSAGGVDEERVEQLVHERVNEIRTSRGLSTLSYDEQLSGIAEAHSDDMLENNYFSHESPGGVDMGDRYDRHGYDCRVSTGGNRYVTGGENLYHMSATASTDAATVADRTVQGWMHSPGHRENLLENYWRREGIGISAGRSGGEWHVYVTQNFC